MSKYTQDNIITLEWDEHIRLRPGMYIGKLGEGTAADDGIYVITKEVIDNSIDEFMMGNGRTIDITIADNMVTVNDRGRGIPLEKLFDCVARLNTGAKYDSEAFQRSIGMNGVGIKATNALSKYFRIESRREGQKKILEFEKGKLTHDYPIEMTTELNGTKVSFVPDDEIFGNYKFYFEYIEKMLWNYVYLNRGLTITLNGQKYFSKNGLYDLLTNNLNGQPVYEIAHLQENDFELAFTHLEKSTGEEYYTFVNGQHTIHGGTHQNALKEAIVKAVREFYKKDYDAGDIRQSICAALSIRIQEPVFESQTKTKLGSTDMKKGGPTVRWYINEVVCRLLDNYLHIHSDMATALQKKIIESEKDRKAIAGIRKIAKESAKKTSLVNKKLRDCNIHLTDEKNENRLQTTLFITEGLSASGSITQSRNAEYQAVFSLRGKPLNSFGESKQIVYKNEEFNLLQAALNIEDGLDGLRYNNVIIATDADDDGMHIRLLLLTFFLQFFPELIKAGHLYILQTPLFRVRNKKETIYCYSEEERQNAVNKLGNKPEITRFKGLGEISPPEFKNFIGKNMRIDPVVLNKGTNIDSLLTFYMGRNTPERQKFIIENLIVEEDIAV
ncbi:MAG: type IIA DNA topoisomerase subunit B [Bacteroidales bacterium]|jgi:topoisomerase-4 subunit B|nr:type IIA DNA topoisomerase subunit B [Bacteroidales bacterium]